MKNTNIIVFGAAGFIGTYLIDELLDENFNVTASDINKIGEMYYKKNNVPYFQIDITNADDFEKVKDLKFDTVIHLAALQPANVSEKNFSPREYINVNVIGTINILDFCVRNKIKKIIYACSHRNTQGVWKKDTAIKESDGRSIKYHGEYAMFSISENTAQDCLRYYLEEYGIQTINFRLPPVYGYGPHTEIFKNGKPVITGFQTFIENAIACKPIELWGDSSVGRDIIYVKDVVSAFIKAINSKVAQGLFNITSGKYLTLKEQVDTTVKVFWGGKNKPEIIELPDKPHHMDSFLYDNSKAKQELNWSPQYSFEAMLLDYKKEMKNQKFKYLIEKRKMMFEGL